jgi:hypothetical protein
VNSWIFDNDGLVCVELREDNDALVEQGQEVNVDLVRHHRCPEESIFPNYDYRARARIYHLFLVFCSFSAEKYEGQWKNNKQRSSRREPTPVYVWLHRLQNLSSKMVSSVAVLYSNVASNTKMAILSCWKVSNRELGNGCLNLCFLYYAVESASE